MSDAAAVLKVPSPYKNVSAFVEQDESCCYLYLIGETSEIFPQRACWVRNVRPAPETLDLEAMRSGRAPMMPRAYCRHPFGAAPLTPDRLRIVWSETGESAALYEDDELLVSIPAWSGSGGFHGYARDCVGQSPLAWELGESNAQHAYFHDQEDYWQAWNSEPGPWPEFQEGMCQAYNEQLGTHSNYYAVDGGEWPPRALLRIEEDDRNILVTVGMSLRAQPRVEMLFDDPSPHRRIEIGGSYRNSLDPDGMLKMARYLGAQSNLPWAQLTYLEHGHTIACETLRELTDGLLISLLLVADVPGAPTVELPCFRNDPVKLLWTLPISERERELAIQKGSHALIEHLTAQAVSMFPAELDRRCTLA